jgi:hypothetical protein
MIPSSHNKNRRQTAALLGAAFLLSLLPASAAPAEVLRAALAREDITPTQPVTLAGYASRKDLSQGVHDPLSARVVTFEQAGRRLVLVSLDSIGFYAGTAAPLRQAILEACQLPPEELFLTATHSHSSPGLTLDPAKGHANNLAYTQTLRDRLPALVRGALARLEPVRLAAASGSSPVGVNRREPVRDQTGSVKIRLGRNPAKLTDREVQVVKITRTEGGALVGALFDYATHSTAMGPRNYRISGDVHGLAAQFVERHLGEGMVAPALVGASGDIDPWFRVLPEFTTKNGWIPEPVLMGAMLGEEVVHVLNRTAKPGAAGPLRSAIGTIQLPAKPRNREGEPVNHATLPFNVTVARIGEVALVGLGGEVCNEIGAAIKAASPFPMTVVITHCNGGAGYLVPAHYYPEGGYEPETSPFTAEAAAEVIAEAGRLLREL